MNIVTEQICMCVLFYADGMCVVYVILKEFTSRFFKL